MAICLRGNIVFLLALVGVSMRETNDVPVMSRLPKEGEWWQWGAWPAFVISHDWTYSEYHQEMKKGGKSDGDPVFRCVRENL